MRLIRLWPDNSHFDFMRFRRVSFPFSAFLSRPYGRAVPDGRPQFRHRLQGRHAHGAAGEVGQGRCRPGAPDRGRLRLRRRRGAGIRQRGRRLAALCRSSPAARRRRAPSSQKARDTFGNDYEFRRVETVGPRVSGELVQSGTIGVVLSVIAVLFYLWFRFERELAVGAIIGTLHDIVLTHRLLRHHAARVQHDLDRRDPDHRRLFAERDRRRVRPHARTHATLQDDAGRGAAQPVDQPHDVAHGDDRDDDDPCRSSRSCCSAAARSRVSRR